MTAIQPITDQCLVFDPFSIQTAFGSDRALLVQILDESISLALTGFLADYQKRLAHLPVHLHQPSELILRVAVRQPGHTQEHFSGCRGHWYALSSQHELLVKIPFLHP